MPRPSWAAAKATLAKAAAQGFRIVDLTLEQVCELHAARELYSDALQGNIAYSGAEALAWLQRRFAAFLKDIAFPPPTAEAQKEYPARKAEPEPSTERKEPPAHQAELDPQRLRHVLDIVREQRIVDISAVLSKLGSQDLRDPLLRSVEAHPNLRAHPGPRTIFLQWRITA
jgi:hypothetical protein